nr:MAG TPA: hypothetical protein [Caudoviricetes sp.]
MLCIYLSFPRIRIAYRGTPISIMQPSVFLISYT